MRPTAKVMVVILLALSAPLVGTLAGRFMSKAGYRVMANLTPSIPVGLYIGNTRIHTVERGQTVAFKPHNSAGEYAFIRGWMKPHSLYMKRVAAIAGDTVCANAELTVMYAGSDEANRIGNIAKTDNTGQVLPRAISGCLRVPDGYFLPIGDGLPNSYDGRYYGLVPVENIEYTLKPLITREPVDK